MSPGGQMLLAEMLAAGFAAFRTSDRSIDERNRRYITYLLRNAI
jgi:hypothetical protein